MFDKLFRLLSPFRKGDLVRARYRSGWSMIPHDVLGPVVGFKSSSVGRLVLVLYDGTVCAYPAPMLELVPEAKDV